MKPKDIVIKWVDAFNAADVEAIVSLYGENAVNHQVANEPVAGRSAIKAMFEAEFAAAEMTCIIENIFEDGQWAILEWRDPLVTTDLIGRRRISGKFPFTLHKNSR